MRNFIIAVLAFSMLISACGKADDATDQAEVMAVTMTPSDPIATYLPSTAELANIDLTPTPDDLISFFPTFTPLAPKNSAVSEFPTPTPKVSGYEVRSGDYWFSIANDLGVSVDDLLAANDMTEYDIIYPGDILKIPESTVQTVIAEIPDSVEFSTSDYFKIIPDSELVYGPATAKFDVSSFIANSGGYLSTYREEVDDRSMSGAQIIQSIADNYSVNPRLLLAILEHRSNWVTRPEIDDATKENPYLLSRDELQGLFKQSQFVANALNTGYYNWLSRENTIVQLTDGSYWQPSLGVNAGTAGVLTFFATISDPTEWKNAAGENGVVTTFRKLFGNPFQYAVEPIGPTTASQPKLNLPFATNETWYFTGGPHGGWDEGSALAAIDFAPPEEYLGCDVSEDFATAVADGTITRSANGVVVLDLDGDGYEQTGWVIVYLHISSDGAAKLGDIKAGDKIGHPSCEGGVSFASHLHIARKYNGQWISATDALNPFKLGKYTVVSTARAYDGYLQAGADQIEAFDGYSEMNKIEW